MGGLGGFVFCVLWDAFFGIDSGTSGFILPKNCVLFGMAGLMSGVMHAPLTGIFLIAELTGGYELLVPLMIVSAISYMTINIFEPHSIYAMRLARKGESLIVSMPCVWRAKASSSPTTRTVPYSRC